MSDSNDEAAEQDRKYFERLEKLFGIKPLKYSKLSKKELFYEAIDAEVLLAKTPRPRPELSCTRCLALGWLATALVATYVSLLRRVLLLQARVRLLTLENARLSRACRERAHAAAPPNAATDRSVAWAAVAAIAAVASAVLQLVQVLRAPRAAALRAA